MTLIIETSTGRPNVDSYASADACNAAMDMANWANPRF